MRRTSPGLEAGYLRPELMMPQLGVGLEPSWVEMPASVHGGLSASVRASGSTARPSETGPIGFERIKSEHGRKSVTWGEEENRSMLRSSRSEGASILTRPKKRQESPNRNGTPPLQNEHELQTQLNLLRERSWTETQSLRKQLEDSKTVQDRLRKELEQATVQNQQLHNETQDLRDRVSAAGGLAQDPSATQLFEEKNAQIRHLEALVKELASSQSVSVGTVRPQSKDKLRHMDDKSQKDLQAELEALRVERAKEQDDLKELEQVVAVFEAKMASIKKENKDLKRTVGELRQMIALSEEAGHQMVPLASSQERRLQSINENLSRRILETTIRQSDFRCILATFSQWKAAGSKTGGGQRRKSFGDVREEIDSLSDQNVSLKFQLEKSAKDLSALREEMGSMKAMYVNMLESERTQSAVMAQRMMKVEDVEQSLNTEVIDLRKANKTLVEQLDACKRRLEYLDGERRSAEPDSEEERTRKLIEQVHSLQDDVASLTALRSSSTQRLALLREMGIVRTVGHKRQMTLNRVLQAWRRCPSFGAEAQRSALNIRACKDKLLALQVLQGWSIEASFESKAAVAERSKQLEGVQATVKALQSGKMEQNRELQEQTRRCEEMKRSLCLREQDVETLRIQLAAAQKSQQAAKVTMGGMESRLREVLEELPAAKATAERLEDELQEMEGVRREVESKVERLMAEREGWVKEQSRVRHRQVPSLTAICLAMSEPDSAAQASCNGATPLASDIQAAMLAERCQVLAHKLDAAEVERSKTAAAAASVVSLRDGMHALVGTLCAKASVLAVRHPTPSRQLLEGQDTAGCVAQALMLGREVEVVSSAMVTAAQELQLKLDKVMSAEGGAQQSEIRGGETRELRERVEQLGREVRAKQDELARVRADMEHDIETKQQQVSSLTASLALAQQEVRYLQDIADGGSSKSAFAQSLGGLASVLATLNHKLGAKTAECRKLERHLHKSMMDGQNALLQTQSDNDALRQQLLAASGQSSAVPATAPVMPMPAPHDGGLHGGSVGPNRGAGGDEKLEMAMQASAALSEEVKEMTHLWRQSAAEAFEAVCRLGKLQEQLEEVQGLEKERRGGLKKLEEENRKQEEALRRVEREGKRLAEELGKTELRLLEAETKVGEREGERDALQSAMRELVETKRELEKEQAVAEQRANQLEQDQVQLQKLCNSLKQQQQNIAGLVSELGSMAADGEMNGMREELARLQLDERCAKLTKQLEAAEAAAREAEQGGSGLVERLQLVEAQRAELVEQVREGEERVQAMAGERQALEQELEALGEERGRLAQEVGKAKREAEEAKLLLEEERGDWEQEKGALEEAIAKREGRLEEAEKNVQRLEAEVRSREEEERVLKGAIEEAKSAEREQQEREERLRKEVKEVEEQRREEQGQREREAGRAAAELRELSGRLEEAVKERERKERGESTVKKELEAVGERRREAEAALARAEGEASHMAGTIRAMTRERDELAERVRELGEAVSEGRKRVRELERDLEESKIQQQNTEKIVESASSGAETRVLALRAEIEEEKKETARAQTEKEYLKERVQALKAAGEEARRAVEERERLMGEVMLERTALKLQLLDSERLLEGRDVTVKMLEEVVVRSETKLGEVEIELEEAEAKVEEQASKLEGAGRDTAAVGERVEELEGRLREKEEEAAAREEERKAVEAQLEGEKEELREEARGLVKEIEEGRAKAEELERERGRETEAKEALEEERKALASQLEELGAEAARRREEAEASERGAEEARGKTEQLRKYLEEERGERENQEAVLEEMRVVLEQAERELNQREENVNQLKETVKSLEEELETTVSSRSELETKLHDAMRDLEASRAALDATEQRAEDAAEAGVALKTRLSEMEKGMEAMWQEGEEVKGRLAAVEEKERELSAELEARATALAALRASSEEEQARLEEERSRAAGEAQEWKGKHAKAKAKEEGLTRRLEEVEEEAGRSASRVAEYDEILQGKGREVAKLHGRLAEEEALVADANERLGIMRGNEEKMRGEMAAKDKQVKRLQAELDELHEEGGGGGEGRHVRRMREELEEARQEGAAKEGKIKELEAMVLQAQMRVADAKVKGLEGSWEVNLKESPGNVKVGGQRKPELDDSRSKASTDPAVTPGREAAGSTDSTPQRTRSEGEEMGVNPLGKEEEGGKENERLREELERVKKELMEATARCEALEKEEDGEGGRWLEAGEGRELACGALRRLVAEREKARKEAAGFRALEEHWVQAKARRAGFVSLLVRCQKSVRRRTEERATGGGAWEKEREALAEEKLGLQRELVEKTDALLAAEKKFAHLLSWVQKNKSKSSP